MRYGLAESASYAFLLALEALAPSSQAHERGLDGHAIRVLIGHERSLRPQRREERQDERSVSSAHVTGRTFWFNRKKFSGSYLRLRAASRS